MATEPAKPGFCRRVSKNTRKYQRKATQLRWLALVLAWLSTSWGGNFKRRLALSLWAEAKQLLQLLSCCYSPISI